MPLEDQGLSDSAMWQQGIVPKLDKGKKEYTTVIAYRHVKQLVHRVN